ncbi:hypothetical protein BJ138DRAFT_1108944 [Hygrophoropsis aurantiaca]|uniref:Uncharacterized protein n=1 Tax=Hygrophoropsis aurantiaca TaxID=72124 RepID=A0ACB8AT24_9AGAM|nr:hypothetical protein BJ138DRAFT_1108944 [Hygrophoropsis aurantiaca]
MQSPTPPSGLNYVARIKPALVDIMIGHTFTVVIIPLLIALFYFSNKHSRRQPIFILNVFTLCLAFAVGIMGDSRAINAILSPSNPYPVGYDIFMGALGAVQSILVDTILLVRLLSVYPRPYIGWRRFLSLVTLPVIMKIARVINLFLFIAALTNAAKGSNAPAVFAGLWLHAPYLKIEWFAQLIDNSYASIVFMWTLHTRNKSRRESATVSISKLSFGKRLKTLFWIALSNFVIPALFSLAQIIVVYRSIDPVVINQICLANTSVAVIGVVFATVWAGSAKQRLDDLAAKIPDMKNSSISKAGQLQFAARADTTTGSGADSTHRHHEPMAYAEESVFEMYAKTRSAQFETSTRSSLDQPSVNA